MMLVSDNQAEPVRRRTIADSGAILVVGLGETGLSCARYLGARNRRVIVADTRERPPGMEKLQREFPGIKVYVGGLPAALLDDVSEIVVSPGLDPTAPFFAEARNRHIPVVGDIEVFARAVTAPVIAITGSNGKSTVTRMVAAMLAAAGRDVRSGGNLGPPALDLIGENEPEFFVLELSSFQLESVSSLAPAVACVLNISPDHMDRHRNLQAYVDAKARIFRNCRVAVVNRDDQLVSGIEVPGMSLSFGLDEPGPDQFGLRHARGSTWLARGQSLLLNVADIHLVGRHNLANALAALAVATAAGAPAQVAAQALRSFRGLPHRMQRVASVRGATWINDSKGTNVGATVAAIRGLSGNLVLIAGGDGKNADFSALADAVTGKVHTAVLLGRDARQIGEVLENRCTVLYADSMESAVSIAANCCRDGDTVLMSPACASFDMFRNFEHRGEVFARAVRGLTP